jgi:hypothetical protein
MNYSFVLLVLLAAPVIPGSSFAVQAGPDVVTDYYRAAITPFGTLDLYDREGNRLIAGMPQFEAYYFKDGGYFKARANLAVFPIIEERNDSVFVTAEQNLGFLTLAQRFTLSRHSPLIECRVRLVYRQAIDSVFFEVLEFPIYHDSARIVTRDLRQQEADRARSYVTDKWTTRAVEFGLKDNVVSVIGEDNLMAMRLRWQDDHWQLDYDIDRDRDHPFFRAWDIVPNYPTYETLATAPRFPGDTQEVYFRVAIGARVPILKRERQPSGCQATLVITEHADCDGPMTAKGIAYGSSYSDTPIPGRGLLGNGLTWTKAVFRWHTWGTRNANLGYYGLDRPDYKQVIDSLRLYGVEIALHTPRSLADSADTVGVALRDMRDWYQTRTWIDHGMDFNQEALSKFGTYPESVAWYIADTLQLYGIDYIWQAIDMPGLGYWGHNLLAPEQPEFYPPILYTQPRLNNRSLHRPMYLWPAFGIGSDNDRDYHLSPDGIGRLIDEQGVDILHVYFGAQDTFVSRRRPSYANWLVRRGVWPYINWDSDPWLDECFQFIADRKQAGLLRVPTLAQFCDYLLLSDSVELRALNQQDFLVVNHAHQPVSGFTLSLAAEGVGQILLDRQPVAHQRPMADDIICWFDVPADTTLHLRIEKTPLSETGARTSGDNVQGRAGVSTADARVWVIAVDRAQDGVTLGWRTSRAGPARLEVWSPVGRRIKSLRNGWLGPGAHQEHWNGTDQQGRQVAPGLYVLRLIVPRGTASCKALLVR